VASNAATGTGVGPTVIDEVIGIAKAYSTRVGGGPYPTEQKGPVGEELRRIGQEFGATTGRPRRCGWLDAAALKRSIIINGISGLCITKLDVLDGLKELQLCTGYELDGQHTDILPLGADEIARCKPVYETMEGWSESTVGVTQFDKLPVNARLYLQRIEQVTGVPVDIISTSPDREHTIMMRHPYLA
jgi:adenylosuccinate synthase